jgi:hypothetical protein
MLSFLISRRRRQQVPQRRFADLRCHLSGLANCLKLLLGAGSDPRSSWKGTSAPDIARQKQHAECTRLLEAALA